MDVLVIGYGKIGRIKSFIWRSLGRKVSVYDVDPHKESQAKADGFIPYDPTYTYEDLIVDISTPAAFHLNSLRWMLERIRPLPRSVLIEKPLVSNETEWEAMRLLFIESPSLKGRIIVNESYYLSSVFSLMAREMIKYGPIHTIEAEMSKNRLSDVAKGRFVDEYLGSFGIELPHMIAMVERLGVGTRRLKPENVVVYRDINVANNEGFAADLLANGVPVRLRSYLGDFRMGGGRILPNESIVRSLRVKTSLRDYRVLFDPVEGLGRYMAKVTIFDRRTHKSESLVLDDNHLAAHLKKIHSNAIDKSLDELFSASNALEISDLIFRLKDMACYSNVSTKANTHSTEFIPAQPHIAEGISS